MRRAHWVPALLSCQRPERRERQAASLLQRKFLEKLRLAASCCAFCCALLCHVVFCCPFPVVAAEFWAAASGSSAPNFRSHLIGVSWSRRLKPQFSDSWSTNL